MAGVAMAVGAIGSAVIASEASSAASKRAAKAGDGQNQLAWQQAENARVQQAFWEDNYAPQEQRLAQTVRDAGSKAEQDEASAAAGAAVARAYDDQSAALDRNMAASGNNPADPNYQALKASISSNAAPAIGGARYWAAKGVRDDAFNKQMGFVQIGRNIPGQVQAGLSSAASQLGNISSRNQDLANQQSVNAANATKTIWDAGVGAVRSWNQTQGIGAGATAASAPGVTFNPAQTGLYGDTATMIGLKTGGIVEGPTVAALAEDGKPEAVLNAGALKILGRDKVAKLNRMGETIAKRGVSTQRHMSLGEH